MFSSFGGRALGLDLTPAETIAAAAAAGFDAADLLVRDVVEGGIAAAELRRRMDDAGLRGGAWPLPVHWRGDAGRFAADLASLPRYAAAAAELGLAATGTWVLPAVDPAWGRDRAIEFHRRRLGPIARVLHDHGSRLGLEVIGVESARARMGRPFVHRLADLGPLLDALAPEAPNVGILADAFHLFAAREPVEAALARGVGAMVWVHLADLPAGSPVDRGALQDDRRGLPGEHGAVPCRDLLEALGRAGFAGPVTVETLKPPAGASPSPAATAGRVREALRAAWPTGRQPA